VLLSVVSMKAASTMRMDNDHLVSYILPDFFYQKLLMLR
jgi:hypothetical protein